MSCPVLSRSQSPVVCPLPFPWHHRPHMFTWSQQTSTQTPQTQTQPPAGAPARASPRTPHICVPHCHLSFFLFHLSTAHSTFPISPSHTRPSSGTHGRCLGVFLLWQTLGCFLPVGPVKLRSPMSIHPGKSYFNILKTKTESTRTSQQEANNNN